MWPSAMRDSGVRISDFIFHHSLTRGSAGGLELHLCGFIRSMSGRKWRNSSGTGLKEEVKGRLERAVPSLFRSFFLLHRMHSSDSPVSIATPLGCWGIVGYHHGLVYSLSARKTFRCRFLLCWNKSAQNFSLRTTWGVPPPPPHHPVAVSEASGWSHNPYLMWLTALLLLEPEFCLWAGLMRSQAFDWVQARMSKYMKMNCKIK